MSHVIMSHNRVRTDPVSVRQAVRGESVYSSSRYENMVFAKEKIRALVG